MKIALVRPKVGFGLGGAENYVSCCALGLRKLGHEVTIIADYCDLPQVSFLRAPMVGRGSLLKNLSFFLAVKKVLKKHSFDLVYTCARTAPSDIFRPSDPLHAVWIRYGYRFRQRGLRSLRPRHRLLLWLEKQALSQTKAVVANSKLVKKQITQYYPLFKKKIKVIYNGIDFSRFNLSVRRSRTARREKLNLDEDKKVLLFVGADWRRKGLDLVQKILPKLKDSPLLVVAGGPALRPRKNTVYLGPVPGIEEIYGMADLLVLPTRYDPFANVVVEALACGLPAVTSPWNGSSELIRAGETGFVVDNQPENLLRAVSGILAALPSPEVCHQSVRHLTWAEHINRFLDFVSAQCL